MRSHLPIAFLCAAAAILPRHALAQEAPAAAPADADALAKALSNPVAALISVPLQLNYDSGYGVDGDGERWLLNVQPVVPMSLNEDWNIISRTIMPFIHQSDVVGPGSDTGIGDTTQSLFFSPKKPTASGGSGACGPAFLLPTATEDVLGTEQWAIGPTAVVLKQTDDGWTYGALVNYLVSVAGDDDRADVNSAFLQPFLSKGLGKGRTATINLESTYDFEGHAWSIPVNLTYSKVTKIGNQMVSFAFGGRAYVDAPTGGRLGRAVRGDAAVSEIVQLAETKSPDSKVRSARFAHPTTLHPKPARKATPPSARTRVERMRKRGHYDRATIDAILDAGLICHVGFIVRGAPVVIPTLYWREGDYVYLHGSIASRMLDTARKTAVCVTVTHLDALVLTRSAFHHSVNYRSVVIFGQPEEITEPRDLEAAMRVFMEGLLPGRWDALRPVKRKELKATRLLRLPIDEVSAKIRSGPPSDDKADLAWPVWGGLIPIETSVGTPQPDEHVEGRPPCRTGGAKAQV